MDIEQIKKYIEIETSLNNLKPYKDILNFCMKIHRHLNKDRVKAYNLKYQNKINLIKIKIDKKPKINLTENNNKDKINLKIGSDIFK